MALGTTNISVSLVRDELGAGMNDVGQLCIHPNINKWSKWKPIKFPKIESLTQQELENSNYGIEIVSSLGDTSNPKALYDMVQNLGYTYKYNKPTGGVSSPYRLSDFRNYEKAGGVPPISTSARTQTVVAYVDRVFKYGGVEPQPSDFLLSKSDLYPSFHRGILLYNITQNKSFWTTNPDIWWSVSQFSGWAGDDIRGFEFIVTHEEDRLLTGGSNQFFAGGPDYNEFFAVINSPNAFNPYIIDLKSSIPPATLIYQSTLSGIYNYSINKINYNLTFSSTSTETKGGLIKNIQLQFSINGVLQSTKDLGDWTLPNNSTKSFIGAFDSSPVTGMTLQAFEDGVLIETARVIITG